VLHRRIAGWAMCLLVGAAAPFCRELSAPSLRRLCAAVAKYSYGIYLTHIYAMWLAFVVLKSAPVPAQWATLAFLSVGVPVLLFHALEQPFIRFGAACADRLPRSVGTARPLAPPAT
jgi:peptidoglycan/LPS O-acetylase OafA/YrhL